MTDAELLADLDAISAITGRWKDKILFALICMPYDAAKSVAKGDFVVQSNIHEDDLAGMLRYALADIEGGERAEYLPVGRAQ